MIMPTFTCYVPTNKRGDTVQIEYMVMNIIRALPALALCLFAASFSSAALTPIDPLDFASGGTTLDFAALPTGTEANGLVVNGVLFQVTKSALPTNGIVIVDAGPGSTGNITPPNLVSISEPNDVALIVSLPNLVTQFGYGYALLAQVSIPAATTIDLFAGATPVGSIPFSGIPDPTFTGGFAGVASNTPFDRAVLTFSDLGDAFAVDNLTFARTVADQGSTLILLSVGLFVLSSLRVGHRGQFRYQCRATVPRSCPACRSASSAVAMASASGFVSITAWSMGLKRAIRLK
jgi:hypothetical protein